MNQFFEWISGALRAAKWWAVVMPWERAVRVRAGKHTRVWEPGWHWRIPFLDEVRTFNNRLRISTFPSLTITSKDGRTVTAAGLVGFRIVDPLRVILALQQPEHTCGALVMAFASEYLGTRAFAEVTAAEFETAALAALTHRVPGCQFEFVRLTDFAAVRTYRLLQEQWRPNTQTQAGE